LRDGFFLKAIALTKQILKRSPQRIELNEQLAEWHLQLELRREARACLEGARDGFTHPGRRDEARRVQARIDAFLAAGQLDEEVPKARA
jgi:hypothetical protein